MLTKGEIQSIDFVSNTCIIRLPLFETAGMPDKMFATAHFATAPGQSNGYKSGDIVVVGFESDRINKPIILGSLYSTQAVSQSDLSRGSLSCINLKVSDRAELPINTSFTKSNGSIVDPDGLNSIQSIVNYSHDQANKIKDLETKLAVADTTLLWENENSTSEFGEQTITLNTKYTEFKRLQIFYRYYFNNCAEQSITVIGPPTDSDGAIIGSNNQIFLTGCNDTNDWASRQVNFINETQLSIFSAKALDDTTEDNCFCIPTKIYGDNRF